MRYFIAYLAIISFFASVVTAKDVAIALPASSSTLLVAGAKLEKLADGFSFTEGPAADKAGNVYFTDQPNDKIWKWSLDGMVTLFKTGTGRANGLFFDQNNRLLSCSDMDNELWRIDTETGPHTVMVAAFDGKIFHGPNDLWVRPDGGIYFTDPMYPRPYWKRSPKLEQDGQHVYYLPPGGRDARRVVDDFKQPNGIIGTPDGATLYVADIGANKTYRYKINSDGSLTEKTFFAPLGSDGMTLDAEGNVYLTGKGVTIFNPQGKKIGHIAVPEGWTANVCFGGRERDYLFITASKNLWRIKMNVRGSSQFP